MDTTATMPTEMILLGWGIILLLLQLALQGLVGVIEFGPAYAFSPRDEQHQLKNPYGARLDRAFYNLLETFPVFAALALALAVTGKTGGIGVTGAQIWLWARVLYVPAYAFGITFVRTLIWTISIVGLIMMLVALL